MNRRAGSPGRPALAARSARAALVAAVALAAVVRQAAPATAQRPTPIGPATPVATATADRPLADCGVTDVRLKVEPRVLDADAQAVVEVTARFALQPDGSPDRVAVLLGPIAADMRSIVVAELDAFAVALGLERGVELAVLHVGDPPADVEWLGGPEGLERARAIIAATRSDEVSVAAWASAVERAVEVTTGSPPVLSTALLVIADRVPSDVAAAPDWIPFAQRLVDALVVHVVASLDPSGWLQTLAFGRGGTVFALPHTSRSDAPTLLRVARRTVIGMPGAGWVYEHDLGTERWRAFESPDRPPGRVAISDAEVVWTDALDAWHGTIAVRYGIKLATKNGLGTVREVTLADGAHALRLSVGAARSCRIDFDPVNLCVHRAGRADACAPVAATWTASAPSATATPQSTPDAPTGTPSPAPATASATPTATDGAVGPSPRPTATPRPPTAGCVGGGGRRLWLPWASADGDPPPADARADAAARRPGFSRRRPGTPR